MKDFRKQNQGKFDSKNMMKEGGKAWRKLKGGCNNEICKLKEKPTISNNDQFAEFHKLSSVLKKKNDAYDENAGEAALAKLRRKKLK
eukprot:gene762-9013_t